MTPTNHASIARMVATHCCVCQRELTDAESVELGLGPICSHRYYDPLHVPDAHQIEVALGLLAVSGLPDHVTTAFLSHVHNDDANARPACNLLVYWASCHYTDRDEVFKVTKIIRALGYVTLADKLEQDRTVVHIEDEGATLRVFTGSAYSLVRNLKEIPGLVALTDPTTGGQLKRGPKFGWTCPKTQEDHLMAVLGVHEGRELMYCPKGILHIPPKRWVDVMFFRRPATATGPQPVEARTQDGHTIRLVPVAGGRTEVWTPFNPAFKDDLKKAVAYTNRSWTGKCWLVADLALPVVKRLVGHYFGVALP